MEGGGERPLLHFDHALLAVPDLEQSVRAFEQRSGLASSPGGRHPGVGTANAIVSLGSRQYLELIAIVDEAEALRSQRSRRVRDAVERGATFATWALRTEDLEGLRLQLGVAGDIMPGSRERPDGTRLEWRSLELDPGLPFLISWGGEAHPGSAGDGRVLRVVLEDAADGPLRAFLARVALDVDCELCDGAAPRLVSLDIDAGGRTLTVI